MELYFLRHGIAVEHEEWGMNPDSERPLTEEGIAKLKKAALGMERMGLSFDRVISSPYTRALETVKIVIKSLDLGSKLEVSEALVPDASFDDFLKLISKAGSKDKYFVVGHEPSMSAFIGRLITGAKGASINMRKGGLARVDGGMEGNSFAGTLEWILTPRQIRAQA